MSAVYPPFTTALPPTPLSENGSNIHVTRFLRPEDFNFMLYRTSEMPPTHVVIQNQYKKSYIPQWSAHPFIPTNLMAIYEKSGHSQ